MPAQVNEGTCDDIVQCQFHTVLQAAPLVWDDSLASSAATWAAGCPNGHSGYSGVGENMACKLPAPSLCPGSTWPGPFVKTS
jgi:hypothetical protein